MLFQDNLSPYISFVESSAPSSPSAGDQRLFVDTSDHLLKLKNSSGTVTPVATAASGSITASGYTQSTAKMLGRSTASTGAIEEITVGTGLTLSAGTLSASGGGGLAHSYLGYNTVGGSTESNVDKTIYAKPVTPGASGLLLSVGIHVKWQEDYSYAGWVGVWADNSGSPGDLIATNRGIGVASALIGLDLHHSSESDQWIDFPVTSYLTGSTQYWIGFQLARTDSTGSQPLLYTDTSGSDKSATRSNVLALNGQGPSWSSTSKKYSIRSDFLS